MVPAWFPASLSEVVTGPKEQQDFKVHWKEERIHKLCWLCMAKIANMPRYGVRALVYFHDSCRCLNLPSSCPLTSSLVFSPRLNCCPYQQMVLLDFSPPSPVLYIWVWAFPLAPFTSGPSLEAHLNSDSSGSAQDETVHIWRPYK